MADMFKEAYVVSSMALFEHLVNLNVMPHDVFEGSYIEPGCLEHGVVHIHMWQLEPMPIPIGWLIVDPVTGIAERA